jgi:hypothetical protein
VDESEFESILDLGIDFIWKTMHCAAIRIPLIHVTIGEEMKSCANPAIKSLLKARKFRWKTL